MHSPETSASKLLGSSLLSFNPKPWVILHNPNHTLKYLYISVAVTNDKIDQSPQPFNLFMVPYDAIYSIYLLLHLMIMQVIKSHTIFAIILIGVVINSSSSYPGFHYHVGVEMWWTIDWIWIDAGYSTIMSRSNNDVKLLYVHWCDIAKTINEDILHGNWALYHIRHIRLFASLCFVLHIAGNVRWLTNHE